MAIPRRFLSFREHHDAWVEAWLAQATAGVRPVQRLALFDQAFAALWRPALATLGELTLSTAVERTLREAVGAHPQLGTLRVEAEGLSFRELREGGRAACEPQLADALRFLLVEVLATLGSLTGEALTPLLHRELARSGPNLKDRVVAAAVPATPAVPAFLAGPADRPIEEGPRP